MSYYFKRIYVITDHARLRIKQRIKKYQKEKDLIIDSDINNLLSILRPTYQSNRDFYFEHPEQKGYYFVVSKSDNIVTTFTKVSADKFLRMR